MDDLHRLWPLLVMIGAMLVPWLVERFWFGVRFGIFAALCLIFALQCAFVAAGLLAAHMLGPASLLGTIAGVVAGFAYVAIGVVPFVALPVALASVLALAAWRRLSRR